MAWQFDAGTDQLVTGGWTGNVWTLQFWYRIDSDPNNYHNPVIITANSGGGGTTRGGIGTDIDGTSMTVFDAAFLTQAAGTPGVGNWYWVCVIANGTSWTVLHGSDPATATVVGPATRTAILSPGSLVLSLTAEWFRGSMANLKLWEAARATSDARAEGATYTLLSSTNVVRHHTMQTSALTNPSGSGAAFTAGGTSVGVVSGPALLEPNSGALAGSSPVPVGSLAGTQTDPAALAGTAPNSTGTLAAAQRTNATVAGASPNPTGSLAATLSAVGLEHVATYSDADTGGAAVSYSVPGVVATTDGLLVFHANAYEELANLVLVPTASLAGTWTAAGAVLGDAEAPNYQNQNLAARLFVPSESGTCLVSSTEDNENVLIVVHVRAPAGNTPTVEDTYGVALTQSGGGPAAAQALGPVTAVADGLLVGCWAGIRFAANSWSTPAGMTERADLGDPANTQTVMVATQASTAGTTGTRTSTATLAPSGGFAGKLIALGYEAAEEANTGTVAGSSPRPTGALTGTQTYPAALAGTSPRPTGAVAAAQRTAGAVAGVAPSAAGTLAAGQVSAGGLAATVANPVGSLAATQTTPAVLAGSTPRPVADLVEGGVGLATMAGQAPWAAGALAAAQTTAGALAGQAPRAVGSIHEALPAPVAVGLRAGTITVAPGWGTGTPSKAAGWGTGTPTVARGWRAGPQDEED